jgi:hypothetical protein
MIATAVEENKHREAAARQAQLTADPLTTGAFFTALNKERMAAGAPALSTLQNLVSAAEQHCNDMVSANYFDFKNPVTGKDINGFIKENAGDLYFKELHWCVLFGQFKTPCRHRCRDRVSKN